MQRHVGALMFSAVLLVWPGAAANAQPSTGASETREDQMQQRAEAGRFGRYDADDDDERRGWRPPRYPERDPRRWERGGRGMMEEGRSGMADERQPDLYSQHRGFAFHGMRHPGMMEMMMILMDSDGDGAVSLQEFQAGHERIFKAMDADKDGRLTLEEIRNFRLGPTHRGQR